MICVSVGSSISIRGRPFEVLIAAGFTSHANSLATLAGAKIALPMELLVREQLAASVAVPVAVGIGSLARR